MIRNSERLPGSDPNETLLGGNTNIKIRYVVLVGVGMGLLTSCAGMSLDDPIIARKNLMRDNNNNLEAIEAYLKENKGGTADVASHARKVASIAKQIKGLFPKGTSLKDRPGQTRAKPAIWAKRAIHIEQAAEIMYGYAMSLADAADSGDKRAIGAALDQLDKRGCGGCHSKFRALK